MKLCTTVNDRENRILLFIVKFIERHISYPSGCWWKKPLLEIFYREPVNPLQSQWYPWVSTGSEKEHGLKKKCVFYEKKKVPCFHMNFFILFGAKMKSQQT